ncbi:MAG: histidinol-phosphate transaminase [Deltaproteobacteria bacterium]|nr:histidinol-phosphate transaminase [Deltaproteobacteria bacterium]
MSQKIISPTQFVNDLEPYKTASQKALNFRDSALKLDWNEGTIAPPQAVIDALVDYLKSPNSLNWYPDMEHRQVREAISRYVGMPLEYIGIFVGSDGALDYLAKIFLSNGDKVKIVGPTYDQFRVSAAVVGAQIDYIYGENPFQTDLAAITKGLGSDTKLVYLANPNNPTGVLYSKEQISDLLESSPSTLFLIDEAYMDFCREQTVVELTKKYKNLIVLRTFSKALCLAGIRLGYIIADPEYFALIMRVQNTKEVSVLSQVAGRLALEHVQYYEDYIADVNEVKRWFVQELQSSGFHVNYGEGNFILLKVDSPKEFISQLETEGIYIRDRSYLHQLEGYVRITIGLKDQMLRVLGTIQNISGSAK